MTNRVFSGEREHPTPGKVPMSERTGVFPGRFKPMQRHLNIAVARPGAAEVDVSSVVRGRALFGN